MSTTRETNGHLPKGWKMVKFGDVVKDVKESEKNPLDAGLECYIGLEHIEPENLHLKEWGDLTTDEVSFTKRFRKGQVLFGKRRAYQRKVAVAEFDGICSSDILTFEPKDEALLPELLPFIVQSEPFFDHALGTSSGSLSPRTRWSQLKSFEFPLPPLSVQKSVADILLSAENTIRCYCKVHDAIETAIAAYGEDLFGKSSDRHRGWERRAVNEVCDRITVGIVVTPSKYYCEGGVRCFRSANVRRGEIQDSDWVFISEEAHEMHEKSILHTGDVMVVRSGANAGMCCVVPEKYDGSNCIDIVFATPTEGRIVPGWLELFINSAAGRAEILKGERGLAQRHFGVAAMREMALPVPPIDIQDRFVTIVRKLRDGIRRVCVTIENLKAMQKATVASLIKVTGPQR